MLTEVTALVLPIALVSSGPPSGYVSFVCYVLEEDGGVQVGSGRSISMLFPLIVYIILAKECLNAAAMCLCDLRLRTVSNVPTFAPPRSVVRAPRE